LSSRKRAFLITDPGILSDRRIFPPQACQPKLKMYFSIKISGPLLAENPLKFSNNTYNSPKKHQHFSKNIGVLSENN
jgi:hypothetical protein